MDSIVEGERGNLWRTVFSPILSYFLNKSVVSIQYDFWAPKNWFDLPRLRGVPVLLEMEEVHKGKLPIYTGIDPIEWVARAVIFFLFCNARIHRFHKFQWAFMSLDDAIMFLFCY